MLLKLAITLQAVVWGFASAAFCPEIESIEHGSVTSDDSPPYEDGAAISFTCDRGYKGTGKGRITCKDGRWSDPIPYCAATSCRKNLAMVDKERKCRKPCASGKDCKGSFKKCLCDGWCGKSCFNPNADCSNLSPPENGYILKNEMSYGHTVTYGCNEGYILTGRATRVCQSDKKWSGYEPRCAALSACGQSGVHDNENLPEGKVLQGQDARAGAWPWQAILFYNYQHQFEMIYHVDNVFAGGSIIDHKWILTAAHVFKETWGINKKKNPQFHFLIAVGLTRIPENGETLPDYVDIFEPKIVHIHKKFDSATYDHDVALVKVGKRLTKRGDTFVPDANAEDEKLIFSGYVRPVCLPCMKGEQLRSVDISKHFDHVKCHSKSRSTLPSNVKAGHDVIVTGFGQSEADSKFRPKTLQEGLLKIAKDTRCIDAVKSMESSVANARYSDTMLCTENSVSDACQGDSGGPLVNQVNSNRWNKHWVLAGIVSWGVGCGKAYPGFYTSVRSIMRWVWEVIDDQNADIQCPDYPKAELDNRNLEVSDCISKEINTSCEIRCKNGFKENEGSLKYLSCQLTDPDQRVASWTGYKNKFCTRIVCPKHPVAELDQRNLQVLGCTSNMVDATCEMQCKTGYSDGVSSPKNLICKLHSDGLSADWKGYESRKCTEILCPDYPNGELVKRNLEVSNCISKAIGTSCEMRCKNGFKENEDSPKYLSCQLTDLEQNIARWTGYKNKVCTQIVCPKHPIAELDQRNLQVSGCTSDKLNATCEMQCKIGYSDDERSPKNLICKLHSGGLSADWKGYENRKCSQILCPDYPNDELDKRNLEVSNCVSKAIGTSCEMRCKNGFKESEGSPKYLSCQLTDPEQNIARWTGYKNKVCTEIVCPMYPVAELDQRNLEVSGCTSDKVDATCEIRCKTGYSDDDSSLKKLICKLRNDGLSADWTGYESKKCTREPQEMVCEHPSEERAQEGCLKCRTRQEQLEKTFCLPGVTSGNCKICQESDQNNCFNVLHASCKGWYVYELEILKGVGDANGRFVDFTGRINSVYMRGTDVAVKPGEVRRFVTATDCYKDCIDPILGRADSEILMIKKNTTVLIGGTSFEECLDSRGERMSYYNLTGGSYMERIYSVSKCKIARENLERPSCRKRRQRKAKCERALAIDQTCRNLLSLRRSLRFGCELEKIC